MPRVAASHLRQGDSVRVGVAAYREVRDSFLYTEGQQIISFSSWGSDINRIRLRPGVRRAGRRRVFVPPHILLETVLGPHH